MRFSPVWHPSGHPTVCLQLQFNLRSPVLRSSLDCSAGGVFTLTANGRVAGRGMGPELTVLPVWVKCDIADLLHPGKNTIVVVVDASRAEEHPWFAACGTVSCEGDISVTLDTGAGWLAHFTTPKSTEQADEYISPDPVSDHRVASVTVSTPVSQPVQLPTQSVIEQEIWAEKIAQFGEVSAQEPLRFASEPEVMTACKCVRPEAILRSGKTETLIQTGVAERGVYMVLDFGQLVSGFPYLRLRHDASCNIELGFAPRWGRLDSSFCYSADQPSGGRRREWSGARLRSFRYLLARFTHCSGEVHVDSITLVTRRLEQKIAGFFSASEDLDAAWSIGSHSVGSLPETYGRNWLLSHALALSDYYVTGDTRRAAATLAATPVPEPGGESIPQSLAYVLFLESYLRYQGRDSFSKAAEVSAFRLLEAWLRIQGSDGLLAAPSTGWNSTALNALFAAAMCVAAELFKKENGDFSHQCKQAYERVRSGLAHSWDSERGLYVEEPGNLDSGATEWTNGLILFAGLADETRGREIAQAMVNRKAVKVENLVQAFYLACGLWRAGLQEQALGVVYQHWIALLDREGATWSEKAKEQRLVPGPEYFLGSQIVGVRPVSDGFAVVEVAPQFAGLSQAEAKVPTKRGEIHVTWKMVQSLRLRLEREREGGTQLRLPRMASRFPNVSVNDEAVWRNEKFLPNRFVHQIISEERCIILVFDGTGPYEVVVE